MRTHVLALSILVGTLPGQAQHIIPAFPLTPTADGHCTPGEWAGAPTCTIPTAGGTCTIAIACDANALYVAYQGRLESEQILFPELLLDLTHDRTTSWNANDRWFHVSATCCNSLGEYANYDNCQPTQPDWTGVPLFAPGAPLTDTVELAIPWATLGVTPAPGDSIGLGLVLSNTFNLFRMWPAGAGRLSPATWGHLVFPAATGIAEAEQPLVQMLPSPDGHFTLATDGRPHTYRVLDAGGRVHLEDRTAGTRTPIDLGAAAAGVYVVLVDGRHAVRAVVQR